MESIFAIFDLKPLTSSDVILLATGIVVWLYTRAAQYTNELQTKPCIILTFQETTRPNNSSRDGKILVKNIGNGPAYDINILPIVAKEGEKAYTYTFYNESRALRSGEAKWLQMWIKTPDGGVEASSMSRFLFRIIPEIINPEVHKQIQVERPALFIINYKSMDGKKYHSIYRLYSILPPVGDIVMQLLHQGKGAAGYVKARWYHLVRSVIPHEGDNERPKQNVVIKALSFLHNKFH